MRLALVRAAAVLAFAGRAQGQSMAYQCCGTTTINVPLPPFSWEVRVRPPLLAVLGRGGRAVTTQLNISPNPYDLNPYIILLPPCRLRWHLSFSPAGLSVSRGEGVQRFDRQIITERAGHP